MIRVERLPEPARGVGEVVLDRPEKRNALTPDMLVALTAGVEELARDDAVAAIVVRGEGDRFCAGFDLDLCRDDPSVLASLLRELSAAVRAMRRAPKPVVVGAQGAAIAGGCALLGGGDVVVIDRAGTYGYPVTRLGISPAVSAPTLEGLVGRSAARRRLLDPGLFDAEEARRIGLGTVMVDLAEDVRPRAQIEAARLARKPPGALAATKRWCGEVEGVAGDGPFDAALGASLALVGGDEERALLERMWERRAR
jgi:enoyl-CoA hydratase/carnithine racemase